MRFGTRIALEDVAARFGPGESVSLLGPNGAGKSTLLKALAGMLRPAQGAVVLNGSPVRNPTPQVVYVPQRSDVDWSFPVNVLDVVLMALTGYRTRVWPFRRSDRAAALTALERVGMAAAADAQISELSGGQQQRVFLARALLQDGDIYLLDEPFAGLDVPTQEMLIGLFGRFRAAGKTVVYATHDLAQAARCADRVVLLNRRLLATGSPAAVLTAEHLRAAFGGSVVVVGNGTTTNVVVGGGA